MKKGTMSKNSRNGNSQAAKMTFKILDILAVAVLVICVAYLVRGVVAYLRNNQITNELQEMHEKYSSACINNEDTKSNVFLALLGNIAYAEESTVLKSDYDPIAQDIMIQDKYSELYERNNDLVGWIHMNEAIDYPIVWLDDDNDFYMNHDYDKKYSDDGWIFLDKRNCDDMSDDQLLIYGHNMRSGTMFGELDLYREAEYLQKHPIIELESIYEAETRKYAIVSLFDASMNKDHESYIKITNFNFETKEEKQAYIDEVCARSILKKPCSVDSDDQLIMLVTCSHSQPNGRFLVAARELRENETVEQIAEMYLEAYY